MTDEQTVTWMTELYNIALLDIGERVMEHSSWYYTNKNVWQWYMDNEYEPMQAYRMDVENCV